MTHLVKTRYVLLLFSLILLNTGCMQRDKSTDKKSALTKIDSTQLMYGLPSPRTVGSVSLEETLLNRRSRRSYTNEPITSDDLSQILWAAYGISKPMPNPRLSGGFKTAPSAGATYPLEIYALVGNVKDIEPGVYKYIPDGHKIIRVIDRDVKPELCSAALNQEMIKDAPACLLYSAIYSRATRVYGNRGRDRYVCIDLGHSAENVYLQAEALHLGTCAIGAFNDNEVRKVMQIPEEEELLYIMPIGKYFNE